MTTPRTGGKVLGLKHVTPYPGVLAKSAEIVEWKGVAGIHGAKECVRV
jgi:hypothetical protein